MSAQEAQENFAYFMSSRTARIEHLRGLLATFGVHLSFSEGTKTALDRWIATYGAFLYVTESGSSFLTRNPPWQAERAGLNVIFDLGVFLGELAIRESENLHWEMYTDVPTGLRWQHESYQKPVIAGFPDNPRWGVNMMAEVHTICCALLEVSYMSAKPGFQVEPKTLYTQFASRKLRFFHCMARGDAAGARQALVQEG